MTKEERIEYLETERIKIWQRITELEILLQKKTSDYETDAKTSAEKATEFKTAAEEAKNETVQYSEEINTKLSEVRTAFSDFEQLVKGIKENANNSETNYVLIKAIYDNIESKTATIQAQIADIEKIFESKPQIDEKLAKLGEVFTKGDDYDTKLISLYKSITERKKEIDDLYYQIIGYTEKDDNAQEVRVKGLKDELKESYDQLTQKMTQFTDDLNALKTVTSSRYDEFFIQKEKHLTDNLDKWQKEHQLVLKKIESLLPNALTTGLSYAYSEKKQAEEKENNKHLNSFQIAIKGLVVISLIPFAISLISIFQRESWETVIFRIPRIVLAILPLYLPVLWVAYSANRKMNLTKRLIEEYSHKEVLSKTFEGLSKQINTLDDKDITSDLRVKLLYNILEVSSENPGKLISDYNKSDHPIMDALDKSAKLTDAVTNLEKIPGLSKLVATMQKKSEDALKKEAEKVAIGLSMVTTNGKDPAN